MERDVYRRRCRTGRTRVGMKGQSVPISFRPRSPPFTHKRSDQKRLIGSRSLGSMICCFAAQPSPVIELNRAVAVAMRDGPETGLAVD